MSIVRFLKLYCASDLDNSELAINRQLIVNSDESQTEKLFRFKMKRGYTSCTFIHCTHADLKPETCETDYSCRLIPSDEGHSSNYLASIIPGKLDDDSSHVVKYSCI